MVQCPFSPVLRGQGGVTTVNTDDAADPSRLFNNRLTNLEIVVCVCMGWGTHTHTHRASSSSCSYRTLPFERAQRAGGGLTSRHMHACPSTGMWMWREEELSHGIMDAAERSVAHFQSASWQAWATALLNWLEGRLPRRLQLVHRDPKIGARVIE